MSKSNWDKGFTSGAKAARKASANSVCSLCCDGCKEHGERVERERIIKLLEEHEAISDGSEGGNPAVCSCQQWSLTPEHYEDHIKRLIKGEK